MPTLADPVEGARRRPGSAALVWALGWACMFALDARIAELGTRVQI